MKRFFLLSTFFALFATLVAQENIQGKVLDLASNEGVEMATVRLLRAKDSVFINGSVSDYAGRYSFSKLENGNYILEFKYLGYKNAYLDVEIKNKSKILKNVYLEEDSKILEAAQISGTAAQMIVRNDTVEYNASAFKLQENAVVEDLFKRLPGFAIDANGAITVNGEPIGRIRVDGKKFFDGDMEMITKNFTADMIDKIQVVDEMSEMAQLTGFEDGNTQRIINLKLKPNRKKGRFGNLTTGVGADFDDGFNYDENFFKDNLRYDANTMINFFKDNVRTSITMGANNTNTSRSGRGRGDRAWSGGSGITATQNIGINNNAEFKNDSLELSGNATYNHATNSGWSESSTESWVKDVTNNNYNYSESHSVSNNAHLGYDVRWKMDASNTLIFQPSVSYGYNTSNSIREFEYFTNGDSTSWGNSSNSNASKNVNAQLNVLYSHKSNVKKGRSITVNLGGGLSHNNSEGFNISNKYMPDSSLIRNQRSLNNSNSRSLSFRGSYIEPLWNTQNFLEFTASVNYSKRYSVKDQYDMDTEGDYSIFNEEYSNEFWNTNLSENIAVNYRYQDAKINFSVGMNGAPSQTYSYTLYGDGVVRDITNKVFNYSPNMNLRYNIGGERRNYIRIEYRGRSSEPSINQMQPVKNNSNLMRETVGNPTLLPSFAHSLNINYSKSNAERLSSFSARLNGSITKDAMVSNSIYDATGKQYNQTINAKRAPFSLGGNIMYNTPVIKNRLHFNTNTTLNYQQRIGYSSRNVDLEELNSDDIADGKLILGDESITNNYSVGENISLTFTHDVVEIGTRASIRYSNTSNNLNTNRQQNTLNWSASGNITLHLPFDINIDNNISYSDRQGYANFDQNEVLWNASIDKSIFKKKFVLQLKANDILRQRQNISQNIGDNSVSYSKTDMLSSYFILSLTYKVKRFGGRPAGGGYGARSYGEGSGNAGGGRGGNTGSRGGNTRGSGGGGR